MNEENNAPKPADSGTDATLPETSAPKPAEAETEATLPEANTPKPAATEMEAILPETTSPKPVETATESTLPETSTPKGAEIEAKTTLPADNNENPEPITSADKSGEIIKTVPVSEEQFLATEQSVIADEAHEEATDDTSEETHEDEDDYTTYSIVELVTLLEKYVDEVEVPRFKSRIAEIRNYLSKTYAASNELARERFIESGGIADDFAPPVDPEEDRFHDAIKKFNKKRAEYNEKLEKQRVENLESKNEILNLLKDLIQNEDNINKAFERFHELQAKWRSVGPVPSANVKDLQLTYKFLIDKFYDFIKINRELQDLDQRKNLEAKLQLCEQADELLMEPSLNNAFRGLHLIQDKWRETGPVPRDKKNEIWDRFKATSDKLFERRKEFVEQAKEKRAKNLVEKTALCEAVEAIKTEETWRHKNWQEATSAIGELQAAWKKIGSADKKVNDDIWNRFKSTCDAFYKAKNDHYHKRKQEYAANMQLKTELCIQAEALQESQDWKATTAELIRLQQEWKKSGHVGEKHSEKIWKRFRTACDKFFTNKHTHFSSRDKEHDENLLKKIALIEELEKFVPGTDGHASFEELKNYQRQWSELGMVPIKQKDEINSRYKAVIDGHFDKLKLSSSDRQKMRFQHKTDHTRHADGHNKMDDAKRVLVNKIAELKNDVQVWENNIGFFAKSKNADKLKSEFEEKINQAKAEIDKLKSKLEQPKDE